jgi:hypothetical protein
VLELERAVESKLRVQQKLELAIPLVPMFLDYKIELELGSEIDLNSVREELQHSWLKLIRKYIDHPRGDAVNVVKTA